METKIYYSVFELLVAKFALKCHDKLKSGSKLYSWYWIILPHWRWYLLKYNNEEFKNRYSPYSDYNNCPKSYRLKLWRINDYKYKLKFW